MSRHVIKSRCGAFKLAYGFDKVALTRGYFCDAFEKEDGLLLESYSLGSVEMLETIDLALEKYNFERTMTVKSHLVDIALDLEI